MLIFKVKWKCLLGGCVLTTCIIYDSMVIADSIERVKILIHKRSGISSIVKIAQIGEVTAESDDEFKQEGFFLIQSQPLRA